MWIVSDIVSAVFSKGEIDCHCVKEKCTSGRSILMSKTSADHCNISEIQKCSVCGSRKRGGRVGEFCRNRVTVEKEPELRSMWAICICPCESEEQ